MFFRTLSRKHATQWLFLGIALLALGILVAGDLYRERMHSESREKERLQALTRVIHDNLAGNLAGVYDVLGDLCAEVGRQGHEVNRNERLKTLTRAMPGVRTMLIFDAAGIVRASSRPELIGGNFSQRVYFQTVLQRPDVRTLYVSPPFRTSLGFFAINIVRMIPGKRGEFAGVIAATLDPEYFRTLLNSVLYTSDMWVNVTHESGLQFMMVPEREGQAGKNLAQPGAFFTLHRDSGQQESFLTGRVLATGDERMMVWRTIRPVDLKLDNALIVAVGRNLDSVYDPWRRDAWVVSGLFGLLALFAGGSLYLYQRRQRLYDRQVAQAETALQENARFMKTVTDNIPGMVAYWTADLRCGFANSGYLEWFGKTPEQMHDIPLRELLGEHLFRITEPHIQAVLRGERQQFERTLKKADGSIGHAWASFVPDHDGERVRGFFVLVSDITERKHKENEFRELLEFNQLVIAKSESGIMVHRYTGECILANEAAARILGATKEQMQQHNFRRTKSLRESGILQIADRVLRTGTTEQVEVPIRTSFDKDIWFVGYLVRLNIKGEGYLLSVFNDIAERKKTESAIQEAKQEAEALQDRVRIAERGIIDISEETQARIGQELHDDLGQHLTGVAFLSEVLFRKLKAENRDEQQEAAHITELINDAVAKTRNLAQGLYPVELKEAGLQAMLEQLARGVVAIYKIECDVAFEADIGINDLPTAINLYRIAQEAINNAIKHGNANIISLTMYGLAHARIFEISDNGCGIGNIDEIMKKGGLGMHTMRYRASLMGATLNIHSSDDSGTRVVITLPAAPEMDSHDIH